MAINVYEYTDFALAGREENLLYGTNINFLIELLTFFLSVLVLATTEKKACTGTSEPRASTQMFPHLTFPHRITWIEYFVYYLR